jgi:hypothetical protein
MIYEALSCLTDEINEYFRNKLKPNEDKAILSALVNQDGTIAIQGENKIVITLINVEKEFNSKGNGGGIGGSTFSNKSSSMNINLIILFSAYFAANNYAEALRFLSFTMGFFQYKNVFTPSNTPKLDSRIDKLIFELASLTPEQLNNTWASLGAKYMPSVIYKMRMLTLDESIVREYRPAVSGIGSNSNLK